jgi:hypothetical protein
MSKNGWMLTAAAAVLLGLAATSALAGHCCDCGCGDGVRMVCRLKEDKRKIEKIVYACKCEDICIPGKSCRGCKNCEEVGGDCGCDCECSCDHKPFARLKWFDWSPGCAHVKNVKKLEKFIVTKEVCGWKWVVEEACGNCCPDGDCVPAKDGTPVQKAPAAAASDELPMPPVPVSAAAQRKILGR